MIQDLGPEETWIIPTFLSPSHEDTQRFSGRPGLPLQVRWRFEPIFLKSQKPGWPMLISGLYVVSWGHRALGWFLQILCRLGDFYQDFYCVYCMPKIWVIYSLGTCNLMGGDKTGIREVISKPRLIMCVSIHTSELLNYYSEVKNRAMQ